MYADRRDGINISKDGCDELSGIIHEKFDAPEGIARKRQSGPTPSNPHTA